MDILNASQHTKALLACEISSAKLMNAKLVL